MKYSKTESTAVFVHIPKTAGTTLNLVIERQYKPKDIISIHTPQQNLEEINRFKGLSSEQKQHFKAIKGHTFFGWHQILAQPCTYFTLMRDPVERFISNYFFLLKKENHPLGKKLVEQQVTLEEFSQWHGEDNYQTRFLAKSVGEADLDLKESECNRQTLERAKKNLAEFAVVGTVEEFDKTLLILKNIFGWKNIYYKVKNKNEHRPKRSRLSEETLNSIEDKNKLDLELYQYATEMLQTLVEKQGSSFEHEIDNFKKSNRSTLGQLSASVSSSANKVQKAISLI